MPNLLDVAIKQGYIPGGKPTNTPNTNTPNTQGIVPSAPSAPAVRPAPSQPAQKSTGSLLQQALDQGYQPVQKPRLNLMELSQRPTEPKPSVGGENKSLWSTNPISSAFNIVKGAVKGTKEIYKQTIEDIPRNIEEGAADIQRGDVLKGSIKGSLRTAADFANAVFAPISSVIGTVLEQTGAQQGLETIAQKIVDSSGIADNPDFQEFATKHPNAEKDLNRTLVLLMSKGEKGTIEPKRMVGEIKQGISDTTTGVKQIVSNIKETYQAKNLAKDTQKVDTITQRVLQPKKGQSFNVEEAKKALSNLDDVQGVKEYKDLVDVLDAKIENYSSALDKTLGHNTTKYSGNNLNINGHNYVRDAIQQLDDFYSKTNDVTKQRQIRELESKMQTDGLTVQEINNLAKQHGQDLNAFNAQGELASGLSKQAVENTRVGVKETGRKLFGNKAYEVVDGEISNLIRVRDMAKNVADEVAYLKQKITNRGFGEKIGRFAFQAMDIVTGGTLKAFAQSFFPRSAGLKLLNALDLEKALNKYISQIRELSKRVPNKDATPQAIQSYFNQLESILKLPAGKPGTQGGQIDLKPIDRSGIQPQPNIKPGTKAYLPAQIPGRDYQSGGTTNLPERMPRRLY